MVGDVSVAGGPVGLQITQMDVPIEACVPVLRMRPGVIVDAAKSLADDRARITVYCARLANTGGASCASRRCDGLAQRCPDHPHPHRRRCRSRPQGAPNDAHGIVYAAGHTTVTASGIAKPGEAAIADGFAMALWTTRLLRPVTSRLRRRCRQYLGRRSIQAGSTSYSRSAAAVRAPARSEYFGGPPCR